MLNLLLDQIMVPKARADIHMNLPALQKLDSMLLVGGLFNPGKVFLSINLVLI